ncbi:MAG: hypothetical protein KDD62_00545 [Bdellovibrionales bacterium]|nr:hypothetical protein [Bdellovibrionales bacterium]
MTSRRFLFCMIMLWLGVLITPLYQLYQTNGLLLYANGIDEFSYLQYDYAQESLKHFHRYSQALTIYLHELGLSGGWINLTFDVVCLALIAILIQKCFALLSPSGTRIQTLLFFLVPSFFLTINPLWGSLVSINHSSWMLSWITLPSFTNSVFLRTPEPQASYLLAALAIYLSLRFKHLLPALIVAPLLYPFIALPWLFVVLSLLLEKSSRIPKVYIPVVVFVAMGLALRLYHLFLINAEARGHLVTSYAPLVSVTGLFSLLLWRYLRKLIPTHLQQVSFLLALSPIAASNHQLISGWIAQPNNFEQYWGTLAIAFIVSITAIHSKKIARYALFGSVPFLVLSFAVCFQRNFSNLHSLRLTDELLKTIQDNGSKVATNDAYANLSLSMLYPMTQATSLSPINAYLGMAERTIKDYRCTRAQLLRDPHLKDEYSTLLSYMDQSYQFETKDYFLNSIGRKKFTAPLHRIDTPTHACRAQQILLYTIEDQSFHHLDISSSSFLDH